MFDHLKTQLEKTKEFVKKHPTLTSCAATAAVTAYAFHDRDVKTMKAIAARAMLATDHRFEKLLDAQTQFIDAKGLKEEFINFADETQTW